MGWGTGNVGGGSGGGLNFKVVGNPQPSNAKENTICVDTDVDITGWKFDTTEPENPLSGMVWVYTGTSSTVAFNALKKNGITVYPVSAKQYVSGEWVDKAAKIYQGGVWADLWNGQLYKPGNTYDSITGGWTNWFSSGGSFTVGPDSLDFNYSDSGGGNGTPLATVNKIDITNFTELSAKLLNFTTSNNGALWIGVTSEIFKNNDALSNGFAAHVTVKSGDSISLDLSALKGEYYIVLYVKAAYASGKTHKASGSVTEVKLS